MDAITAPPEEKTAPKEKAAKANAGRNRSEAKRRTKAPRSKKIKASAEELLTYYRRMLLIRRFEEKAGQLYGMGLIAGFCHLYIGEEAVVVGMQAAITPADTMITAYRDHGHALASDMDPRRIMAELMGRASGYSGGKGGSMHIFSAKDNFYGGHGIVGATVPLGTGLAFAHRYRGTDNVSLTYYGDGAANQGQVYEAFNMAALWKLPVVYIIENNQYGMGTSVDRATANSDFYLRGEPFGIPGRRVDGMDVLAVKAAGDIAVTHCRAGKGPYILQMETYRYRGHSMSDPARYRTRDEINKVRAEHDAIDSLGKLIIDGGYAEEARLRDIDRGVKKIVTEAVEYATNDPEPDASELYTDVLVEA
ncbi:MAG: pyruvate dehydrogenase (acetyl-transferring) E1 component subunit alpha [Alphaproteobacteria bacterium]|nr:pyruvate dehydrogenase (acetyl-transferring) E1 component subunit alpha [Alphaproteobacteria bacterium]